MLLENGDITKVISHIEDENAGVRQSTLQAITEFSNHGVWFSRIIVTTADIG